MENNPNQEAPSMGSNPPIDGNISNNENAVRYESVRPDINNIYPSVEPSLTVNGVIPTTTQTVDKPEVQTVSRQNISNSNILVLQWVSYSLWLWVAALTSVLASGVIGFFMKSSSLVDSYVTYGIAAMLVLLPLFIVCDRAYLKREQSNKTGGALAIMTVHAVIFIVSCVASLVAAASSIASLFIDNSDTSMQWAALITTVIVAIFFALASFRVLSLKFMPKLKQFASAIMTGIVVIIIAFGFFGPMAKIASLKNDKLIDSNLSSVSKGVQSYVKENKKLPTDLKDLTITGDAKKLISDNLVTFKNDGVETYGRTKTYKYQLCVKYAQEDDVYGGYSLPMDDDYSSYLSTSGHKAGDVCYKLEYDSYSY